MDLVRHTITSMYPLYHLDIAILLYFNEEGIQQPTLDYRLLVTVALLYYVGVWTSPGSIVTITWQ
jgi:hypothetical protein